MHRTRRRFIASCAILMLALLAPASIAGATVVESTGLVVAKDMQTKQLTLLSGVVLQVNEHTKMLSKAGRRITLAQIEVAPSEDGAVHMRPDAMVRFEARKARGVLVALTVRVMGTIPQ